MSTPAPGDPSVVRLGVALPIFQNSVEAVLRAALQAERAGLDGVFVYDHLWPLGAPGRASHSLFPLLGALAARTSRVALGPLVARVGIAGTEDLVTMFRAAHRLSGGRLIAGLGTGDQKNAAENAAYGVPFASSAERRALVEEAATRLVASGIETWIGAGAEETNALSRALGCPLNFWAATPERLRREVALGPLNWAGNLPRDPAVASELLGALAEAGADWVIVHWPGGSARLVDAAITAGLRGA